MSTPSDITGMTDNQLIEAVATQVMGWEKGRMKPKGQQWLKDDGGGWKESVCPWSPLGNWNHTMNVVLKVLGGSVPGEAMFGFGIDSGQWVDVVPPWSAMICGKTATDRDLQRSILLAALQAVSPSPDVKS